MRRAGNSRRFLHIGSHFHHEDLHYRSHFVDRGNHKLHLMNIVSSAKAASDLPPCLLFHGAVENGKIFYSRNGKGLAPYLARNGFNVFVADFPGRGDSIPFVRDCKNNFGQYHNITDSIPSLSKAVIDITGMDRQYWISHSWGGIQTASAQARFPDLLDRVVCQVHFGSKRSISITNSWVYWKMIRLGWNSFCPFLTKIYGYLPSKKYGIGSDDDTTAYLNETIGWVRYPSPWVDSVDGFDYHSATERLASEGRIPPAWHIAGKNDEILGHPQDVWNWAQECKQIHKYSILGKENGNLENYDHNSMLTSKHCLNDHFPQVVTWLLDHYSQSKKQ